MNNSLYKIVSKQGFSKSNSSYNVKTSSLQETNPVVYTNGKTAANYSHAKTNFGSEDEKDIVSWKRNSDYWFLEGNASNVVMNPVNGRHENIQGMHII